MKMTGHPTTSALPTGEAIINNKGGKEEIVGIIAKSIILEKE